VQRASRAERDYLARIARANETLAEEEVPLTLAEMFDRLERIHRLHGGLTRPGVTGSDEGDLAAHLAFLERCRRILGRGANGA
jgi:hypothetical protein